MHGIIKGQQFFALTKIFIEFFSQNCFHLFPYDNIFFCQPKHEAINDSIKIRIIFAGFKRKQRPFKVFRALTQPSKSSKQSHLCFQCCTFLAVYLWCLNAIHLCRISCLVDRFSVKGMVFTNLWSLFKKLRYTTAHGTLYYHR